MVIDLDKERNRRAIGTNVQRCVFCDKPLSFRDDNPFCRNPDCVFVRIFDGARQVKPEARNDF